MGAMSTRTRWLVGAAVCVVAVIAGATLVRVTEQEEPMLVEVACDPDQFVDKSEIDTTVCYDGEAIEGATQQEEFTLTCNSFSVKNEADLRDLGVEYCRPEVPDIPEDQEAAAGIRPLPD
jgi:hypothetical protein